MKIIVKKKGEAEAIPYDIPPEGITLQNVLGDWSLEARPKTPHGEIRVFLWDAHKRPDRIGRIYPARQSVLSFSRPEVKFTRGLLGLDGELKLTRSMKP